MTSRFTLTAAALTAAMATATPMAHAQDNKMMGGAAERVVIASDPESFVAFFEDAGYPARLTEDQMGDPLIEYRQGSDKYSMFFYDCTDNVDCHAVQFYSGYNTEGETTLEMINEWNAERRFTRAYLTEDGVARIEMDIATSFDGLSWRDFSALLDLWLDRVVVFEDHINW